MFVFVAIYRFEQQSVTGKSVIGQEAEFEICSTIIQLRGLSCLESYRAWKFPRINQTPSNSTSDLRAPASPSFVEQKTWELDPDEAIVLRDVTNAHSCSGVSVEINEICSNNDGNSLEINQNNETVFRDDDYNLHSDKILQGHKTPNTSSYELEMREDDYDTDESEMDMETRESTSKFKNTKNFQDASSRQRTFSSSSVRSSDDDTSRAFLRQTTRAQSALPEQSCSQAAAPGSSIGSRVGGRETSGSRGACGNTRKGKGAKPSFRNTVVGSSEWASQRNSKSMAQNMPYKAELKISHEVQSEKCQLLIFLTQEVVGKSGCLMKVNKEAHSVTIHGPSQEANENVYGRVLECLSSMHSVIIDSISNEVRTALQAGSGMKWLQGLFRQSEHRVACYRQTDNSICLLAADNRKAAFALKYFKDSITIEKLEYDNLHRDYLQSEEWRMRSRKIQNTSTTGNPNKGCGGILIISVDTVNEYIVLEGSLGCVAKAKSLVLDALSSNKHDIEQITCRSEEMSLLKLRLQSLKYVFVYSLFSNSLDSNFVFFYVRLFRK